MGVKTKQTTIPTKPKGGEDQKALSNTPNKHNHKEQKTTANDVLRAEYQTQSQSNNFHPEEMESQVSALCLSPWSESRGLKETPSI